FGMRGVEKRINKELERIKEKVRTDLNALTGRYLRDVIRGVHQQVTLDQIAHVDPEIFTLIFDRIGEDILPSSDKERLKAKILLMQKQEAEKTSGISSSDTVIAHFLSQLLQLHESQQQGEAEVQKFVSVCNKYLVGKQMI